MNNSNSYSRKSKDKFLPLLTSLTMVVLAFLAPMTAFAATFVDTASEPFGTFGEVEYIRYTGRFVGTTALGDYRMAFEIVAPADPGLGNGTVLIEPPHFLCGPAGRDLFSAETSSSVTGSAMRRSASEPTASTFWIRRQPTSF